MRSRGDGVGLGRAWEAGVGSGAEGCEPDEWVMSPIPGRPARDES